MRFVIQRYHPYWQSGKYWLVRDTMTDEIVAKGLLESVANVFAFSLNTFDEGKRLGNFYDDQRVYPERIVNVYCGPTEGLMK